MTKCPCCSHPMLQHVHNNQVYWFCRNCWQEMPLVTSRKDSHYSNQIINLGGSKINPGLAKI